MERKILIVDDDRIIQDSVSKLLSRQGFQTRAVRSIKDAITELQKTRYCLVITEVRLADGNGFELLDAIRKDYPQMVCLIITAHGTIENAVQAIKKGAFDYLTKPIIDDELRMAVERAIKQQSLMSENERLRLQLEKKYSLENIMSQNYKMAKIFELVEAIADSKTTILMTGPSGTGRKIGRAHV